MTRLRLGVSEVQGRLLPKAKMPKAPLEKKLVDAIRSALTRLGILNWSGRVWAHGSRVKFIPSLGKGTPDVLAVVGGRLVGLEAKRDSASHDRTSQEEWRAVAQAHGVVVATVRSVEEALEVVERAKG